MIRLLILAMSTMVFFSASGQNFDYDTAWKRVGQLRKERKPQSAIDLLKTIGEAAKTEKRSDQQIKVFGTIPTFIQQKSPQNSLDHLSYLKEEITQFSSPEKQIAHFVYFQYLLDYYNRNQYLIQDRTATTDISPDDLRLWTQKDFEEALLGHLEASLDQPGDMQKPIDNYKTL